jgi:hypothetical protein
MTPLRRALLVFATIALPLASVSQSTNETRIDVEFEYRLEVQDSTIVGSTTDLLGSIDGLILSKLQEKLPDTDSQGTLLVEFINIQSQIYSACFTSSDECSIVRSNLQVAFQRGEEVHAVEFVTLDFVQSYLAEISSSSKGYFASYTYPSMVASLAKFQMSSVTGSIPDLEISILEDSFMEVFGAIIYAMEGDTEVRDAKFLYQSLQNGPDDIPVATTSISAEFRVSGFCRDCTSLEFEKVVVEVVKENTPVFMKKLKTNSNAQASTYFDRITNITVSVPLLPDPLGPVKDPSIFDSKAPMVKNRQPWFLWFGITMAVLILSCGCYLVVHESIAYEKDDYSTGNSNEDDEDEDEAEGDVEAVYSEEGQGFHNVTVRKTGDDEWELTH